MKQKAKLPNNPEPILTQMIDEFTLKHGRLPEKIVVAPVALLALGLKKSVSMSWSGVPVECRLFAECEVASKHNRHQAASLGVFAKENHGRLKLAFCDLSYNKLP